MGELVREQSGVVESLTMTLVSEIAKREGIDPVQLTPPLNTIIDVDALENLLFGDKDGFIEVEFTYSGHQITIEREEELQIEVE